jgi:cardiolipin synthase
MRPHRVDFLRQAPNGLTVFRFVLAAWFVLAAAPLRVWIVLAAGLTDLLDGLIARRFGLTSWTGALLDAVADKAFTLTVLFSLAASGGLRWWQIAVLLSRDIVVSVIALYGAANRPWPVFKIAAARWPGKVTTALMFALLVAATGLPEAKPWLLWPTMASSLAAAADYVGVFARWLRRR